MADILIRGGDTDAAALEMRVAVREIFAFDPLQTARGGGQTVRSDAPRRDARATAGPVWPMVPTRQESMMDNTAEVKSRSIRRRPLRCAMSGIVQPSVAWSAASCIRSPATIH